MTNRIPRGVTLLETMIYIALFVMIIPTFTLFIMHVWQEQINFDGRMRVEQTASLIGLELQQAIAEADAITTSTSTLGSDSGVLRFRDAENIAVVIDVVTTVISFTGTDQTVHRLRMQRGTDAAVWLTEPEQDVLQWRVDAVRNDANALTGLRIGLNVELLSSDAATPYRNAAFDADTTIALSPHTIEN